jgi:hypothetical protein
MQSDWRGIAAIYEHNFRLGIDGVVMGLGMPYVYFERCLQVHLSTEDYTVAMKGLKSTRRFRRATFWELYPASAAALTVNQISQRLGVRKSNELVGTKDGRYEPLLAGTILTFGNAIHPLTCAGAWRDESRARREDFDVKVGHVTSPVLVHTADSELKRGSVTTHTLHNGKSNKSAPQSRKRLES